MKYEMREFDTEKSTGEIRRILYSVADKKDSLSPDSVERDKEGKRPVIALLLSGQASFRDALRNVGAGKSGWGVQAVVYDYGSKRHVILVALGESGLMAGLANIGNSKAQLDYFNIRHGKDRMNLIAQQLSPLQDPVDEKSNDQQDEPVSPNIIQEGNSDMAFAFEKPSQKKRNPIVFILLAILAVALCVGVLFFVLNHKDYDGTGELDQEEIQVAAPNMEEVEDYSIPSENEKTQDDSMELSASDSQSSPVMESQISFNSNESYMNFAYGLTGLDTYPSYSTWSNSNYNYIIDIPDNFIECGSNIWEAEDGTAYIRVIAKENAAGRTASEALNDYINEIGGSVFYKATKNDWFAISQSRGDIEYYMKAYIDGRVRAFEFVCPHEYLDVYRDYIEYMEDHFKMTD